MRLRTTVNTLNIFAAGVARFSFAPRLPSTVLPCSDASSFFFPTMRFDPNSNVRREHLSAYSTPIPDIDKAVHKDHVTRPAIVESVQAEQRLAILKQEFKTALLNVAENRKKIYEIILDLKEHFTEYGFKSPAAAVEIICQRSKRWANLFCAEIEAELEVYGKIQSGQNPSTEPDSSDKDKLDTLKKISDLSHPKDGEPEKPHIKTRDEVLAEQAEKNGQVEAPKAKPTENGKPKSQLGVWKKTEDCFGVLIRSVDDVHRVCPNPFRHDQVLKALSGALSFFSEWRKSVK